MIFSLCYHECVHIGQIEKLLDCRENKAGFLLSEFVRANRGKSNLIGWRQTLTTSPANHIRFLLVRANKFAKWETGLKTATFGLFVTNVERVL